jgi:hypothetical protein
MALLLILAAIAGGQGYTAPQVQRSFHSQTGMRLVNVPSMTNTDLIAFRDEAAVDVGRTWTACCGVDASHGDRSFPGTSFRFC